jgi:predicted alpha-1,6-mannanase (GH76 family)
MLNVRNKPYLWLAGLALVVALLAILLINPLNWFAGEENEGWDARAEAAGEELDLSFWNDKRLMFNNASPCILQACTDPFNYWWQAHAVDALLDRFARTNNEQVKMRVEDLFEGILERNAGVWPNEYYDDMEWMALAWLRAYHLFGETKYKDAALALWEDIQSGWNEEMGGGIAWRKVQLDYKNTPANAPAVILAVRMYRDFGEEEDLLWAKRIYEWQRATLVDLESGLVWDGINRTGYGVIDKNWIFTYGQGVFIGAAMELYRETGEEQYREDANRTADYVVGVMASPATQLLPNEGEGDGALFKGILSRYLVDWAELNPEQSGKYAELIFANANSLWNYGRDGDRARFGPSWAQAPDMVVQLSSQISGVILMEQAAKLERLNIE